MDLQTKIVVLLNVPGPAQTRAVHMLSAVKPPAGAFCCVVLRCTAFVPALCRPCPVCAASLWAAVPVGVSCSCLPVFFF